MSTAVSESKRRQRSIADLQRPGRFALDKYQAEEFYEQHKHLYPFRSGQLQFAVDAFLSRNQRTRTYIDMQARRRPLSRPRVKRPLLHTSCST